MSEIIVHRHLKDTIKKYKFGSEVPIKIFQDDTIQKVATKISLGIHEFDKETPVDLKTIPYMWNKKDILRFKRINDKKIPINPWDGVAFKKDKDDQIEYTDNNLLNISEIHIVFASDLPSINELYFPNANIEWKINATYDSILKESQFLANIYAKSVDTGNYIYTRLKYNGSIKKWNLNCDELFEKMHTTADIPFIQYTEDSSKILYKVYKKHRIDSLRFSQWSSFDHISKVTIITLYFKVYRDNIYGRMTIDDNGMVYIDYKLDVREKIDKEILEDSLKRLIKWLEKYVTKVHIAIESVSLKGNYINTHKRKLRELTDLLSKLHLIYHYHKLQGNILEVSFKRSANFKSNIDVGDVILSEIRRGTPMNEIIANLTELGMNEKDAIEWINQYIDTNDLPVKKLTLKQTGCILLFSESTVGYTVQIENIASYDEIQNVSKWIQGTLNIPKKLEKQPIPIAKPSSSSSVSESSSSVKKAKTSSSSSNDDVFNEDVGELSLGGALGKKNRGYFLKLLQEADPAIFKDHKNYARECLGNNFRQPIPLSDKEKADIDASEFKDAYDNSVRFGSDPKHMNNYVCPRIWCPVSKIPLTEEQLKKYNGKCPPPNSEEPLLLYQSDYWDNDKGQKHNIGFLNEGQKKTEKGFCLPCCMKKTMKPEALNRCTVATKSEVAEKSDKPEKKAVQKDLYYIKSTGAPLEANRYGSLPKDMFFYLFPDQSYLNCLNTIKGVDCLLRKGIKHENNSLMSAVAYLLGFENINKLVQDIKSKLDIVSFISCENGLLLHSFLDKDINLSVRNEWKQVDTKYKSLFDLSDENKLNRQLYIYKAYKNFIDYLKSNSNVAKNPLHLINILAITHNIQIVIFKRNGADSAILECPMFSNINDLLYITGKKSLRLGLLLQDGGYYEPLELKKVGKDVGVNIFDINKFEPIKKLLDRCPVKNPISPYIEIIRNLIVWIDNDKEIGTLFSPSSFRIQTIILRPDMKIYGFLTKSNILIKVPGYPLGILSILFKIIDVKNILFLEDVYEARLNIDKVYKKDLESFTNKIAKLGLGLDVGIEISKSAETIYRGILTLPKLNPNILPLIPLRTNDNVIDELHDKVKGHSSRWYQVQKMIGSQISKYYDSLVTPLLSKTKQERVNILMNTFKRIPQKHMVQITLEEMPLTEGKESVDRWIKNIQKKTTIYTREDIVDLNSEWLFSQTAIDNGVNPIVLNYEDKYTLMDSVATKGVVETVEMIDRLEQLPEILQESKMESIDKLPSKWNRFKNFNFQKYNIYNLKKYEINTIPDLMIYISRKLMVPFDYDDIMELRFKLIVGVLNEKEKLGKIFDDPALLIAWNKELRKKYKTFDALWDAELTEKTERLAKWSNVYQNQQIWTTDVDFYIFAKLMNISILVIKRIEYGVGKELAKRNELNDLYISSYFYYGDKDMIKKRPIIILYRQKTKAHKYIEYSCIVNESKEFFIKEGNIPADIELLIEHHINKM